MTSTALIAKSRKMILMGHKIVDVYGLREVADSAWAHSSYNDFQEKGDEEAVMIFQKPQSINQTTILPISPAKPGSLIE